MVPNIFDAKNDKNGKSHLYSRGSNLALSVLYPIVLLGNLYGATIQPKSIFRDQHIECLRLKAPGNPDTLGQGRKIHEPSGFPSLYFL